MAETAPPKTAVQLCLVKCSDIVMSREAQQALSGVSARTDVLKGNLLFEGAHLETIDAQVEK
jgi:hypothetical protein